MPPIPSEPASMPTPRNSTSTGTPRRAENLLDAMPSNSSRPVARIRLSTTNIRDASISGDLRALPGWSYFSEAAAISPPATATFLCYGANAGELVLAISAGVWRHADIVNVQDACGTVEAHLDDRFTGPAGDVDAAAGVRPAVAVHQPGADG